MTHIKRLSIPAQWSMSRKDNKFAIHPSPGAHPVEGCIPIQVLLRNVLGVVESAREARIVLNSGKVLVDRKPRKDPGYPVGLMDVVELPDSGLSYRVVSGAKGLSLEKIDSGDAAWKLCRIRGKTTLRKGIQQLNLHDGRNMLIKKDTFGTGDTLKISLPEQKILRHYRLEKGAHAFVSAGRNIGIRGRVTMIEPKEHSLEKSTVTLDTGKGEVKTLRDYIFIEGTGKPEPKHREKPAEKAKPAAARAKPAAKAKAKPKAKEKPAKAAKASKPKARAAKEKK
jgi:small subunit ribosomal protein S4e